LPPVEEETLLNWRHFVLYKYINKYIDKLIIYIYNCNEVVNYGY